MLGSTRSLVYRSDRVEHTRSIMSIALSLLFSNLLLSDISDCRYADICIYAKISYNWLDLHCSILVPAYKYNVYSMNLPNGFGTKCYLLLLVGRFLQMSESILTIHMIKRRVNWYLPKSMFVRHRALAKRKRTFAKLWNT